MRIPLLRLVALATLVAASFAGRPEPAPTPPPPLPPLDVTVPGHPYALAVGFGSVWALTEDEVVRVARRTGAIEQRIPLGVTGFAGDGITDPLGGIAVGDGSVWVATRTEGPPPAVVRSDKGGGVPGVYDPPETTVESDDVPDVPGALLRIDPTRNVVAARTALPTGRAFDVAVTPGRVFAVAGRSVIAVESAHTARRELDGDARIAADGARVYLAMAEGTLRIGPGLSDTDPRPIDGATAVAVGPSGVWGALPGGGVRALDRTDPPIEAASGFTAIASGDGVVWATDVDSGSVLRIDPATGRAISTHPGPGRRAGALAADGAAVWVLGRDAGLARISA